MFLQIDIQIDLNHLVAINGTILISIQTQILLCALDRMSLELVGGMKK